MNDKLLEPGPEYEMKPKLIFCGKLLGMDLYLDLHGTTDARQKHKLVMKILKDTFNQTKTPNQNKSGVEDATK